MKKRWFRQRPWERESPPNLAGMLAVLSDVAHGMAYLHGNNIIHGDLSTCERPSTTAGKQAQCCMHVRQPEHHAASRKSPA